MHLKCKSIGFQGLHKMTIEHDDLVFKHSSKQFLLLAKVGSYVAN